MTGPEAGQERERGLPLRRMSGMARVWLFSVALALGSLALFAGLVQHIDPIGAPLHIPWWALAAGFMVAEIFVVHVEFRRDAYSFSLSEVPLVLGLFFASPAELLVAQLSGAAVALLIHRRQSLLKAAFNLSHFALEVCLASLIFHAVVESGNPLGPMGWLATFLATFTTGVVADLSIGLAISLSEGRLQVSTLAQGLWFGLAASFTNTSLALIGAVLLWTDARAVWLLVVPVATLLLAYRAYTSVRDKHESLGFLYESTRVLQRSVHLETTMRPLLEQTRRMFRAEIAELTFFPATRGAHASRIRLGPGDDLERREEVELDPKEGVWARVAAEDKAILVRTSVESDRLRRYFESRGIRDAMVAPLHGEGGAVAGTLKVANRLGDVSTFDAEDLRLFETLSNHASAAIQNVRLIGQLRESLDRLTEMNRIKDDFVATVSHELRTPLTVIQGFIKTLLRRDVTFGATEQREMLEAAERGSKRLRNLIEQLLMVVRLESRQTFAEAAPVSLEGVARRVLKELDSHREGHVVDVLFPANMPELLTDEMKVHQILSNLVENSLKYSPVGTKVMVLAEAEEGGSVVLSVVDEGPGIGAEHREKIFDRFYQADSSSTRSVGGAGLGLYICRRLAEELGGTLWLERTGESGSVFSLRLPHEPPLGRTPEVLPGRAVFEPGATGEEEGSLLSVEWHPD